MKSKNLLKEQIAEAVLQNFLEHIPESLRSIVSEDQEIRQKAGTLQLQVVQLGTAQILRDELFDFICSIEAPAKPHTFKSTSGQDVSVIGTLQSDGNVTIDVNDVRYQLESAGLLLAPPEDRVKILEQRLEKRTVSTACRREWHHKVWNSALTYDEYMAFQIDMESSLEAELERIANVIEQGSSREPADFLPKTMRTLITLLGDIDERGALPTYVNDTLINTRSELLEYGLARGLSLIGPSSLFYDRELVGIEVLQDHERLINSLDELVAQATDPFSLILAFDLSAKNINASPKYVTIGEKALSKLVQRDSSAIIENFAIALPIVLLGFTESRMLTSCPVFYRRLAAWTWAGFVAREIGKFDFNRKEFLDSVVSNVGTSLMFSGVLESRDAPYWRPSRTGLDFIRGFIRRRLNVSLEGLSDNDLPHTWEILLKEMDEWTSGMGIHFYQFLLGPLDEFWSEVTPLNKSVPEIEQKLHENESEIEDISFLAQLQPVVQCMELSDELLAETRLRAERIRRLDLNYQADSRTFSAIDSLTYLAGIYRDENFAHTAVALARYVNRGNHGASFLLALHTVFEAATAFPEKKNFGQFVGAEVERLAYETMTRSQATHSLRFLDGICRADPDLKTYLGCARSLFRIAQRGSVFKAPSPS